MMEIVEQTHEEKVAMFMKLSKKELIAMLIQANLMLDMLTPIQVVPYYPVYPPMPTYPSYPLDPYYTTSTSCELTVN